MIQPSAGWKIKSLLLNLSLTRGTLYESGAADGEVRSTVKAVIKLMQNMKLTMEQALDTLDITGDEREEVLERLNKKMNVQQWWDIGGQAPLPQN